MVIERFCNITKNVEIVVNHTLMNVVIKCES